MDNTDKRHTEIIKIHIRQENDISSIEKDWKLLAAGKEMTVFQSYEWNRLLVKEWKKKPHLLFSKCMVYAAKTDDHLVMIVPVIIQRIATKTRWFGTEKGIHILGNGSYSDYLNLIYSQFDQNVFEQILQCIKDDHPGLPFFFNDIREDTSFCQYMTEKGIKPANTKISVAVRKKESADEYTLILSKQTKQNLRTSLNRMKKDGISYRYEILGRTTDDKLIECRTSIHTRRLISKLSRVADEGGEPFSEIKKRILKYKEKHNNIIQYSMKEMDNSCIVVVWLNDMPAGYLYGLRDRDSIRIMQNCFDESYHFYSPLFRASYDFILKELYENGDVSEVDFTRGNEDYKYRLGGEETLLYQYVI